MRFLGSLKDARRHFDENPDARWSMCFAGQPITRNVTESRRAFRRRVRRLLHSAAENHDLVAATEPRWTNKDQWTRVAVVGTSLRVVEWCEEVEASEH